MGPEPSSLGTSPGTNGVRIQGGRSAALDPNEDPPVRQGIALTDVPMLAAHFEFTVLEIDEIEARAGTGRPSAPCSRMFSLASTLGQVKTFSLLFCLSPS